MARIPSVLLAVLMCFTLLAAPVAAAPADVDNRDVKVSYPQVYGLGAAGEKITLALTGEIDRYLAKVAADVNKFAKDGLRLRKIQVIVGHTVTYNGNNLLGIAIDEWAYTGGAHPMSYKRAFTFDTRTGDALPLAGLFKGGADWRARLNSLMAEQIAARQIPVFDATPFAGVKDNQEFYLTAGTLVVYYQLYEYTPYVFGFLEFPIPYAQIADLLKPGLVTPAKK
jgi:hypothetical protein